MTQLFIYGQRIPFHATRFVRAANQTPRPTRADDRQGGLTPPSPASLPVNSLAPFHANPDSPKGQRDHGY